MLLPWLIVSNVGSCQILVAQCIIQSESTETTTTVDAFPMTDMKSFYTILQQLHQATTEVLKNCGFEYSLKFLQEMKARVSIIDMSCASLCKTSTEMSTMREFLDQGTTVYTSFLDQNRVPKEVISISLPFFLSFIFHFSEAF